MTGNDRSRRILATAGLACALSFVPAVAQTSASYKLAETTFNNGGNPVGGAPSSAHFRITLDAIGEAVVRAGAMSASYHVDAGFVGVYGPPGEVTGARFPNKTTLAWDPEPWGHRYEVYRGTLASLPGTFGACFANDLTQPTASDASSPSTGQGHFYLVTARNRLREEGPKGFRSNGTEEGNPTPCP
jgi:hypothetical protein